MNPASRKNILATIENLKDAETIYSRFFEAEKQKVTENAADSLIIDIKRLKKTAYPKLVLLEILTAFNFNPSVTNEILQSLDNEPGKQFFSKTHRLIKDREKLFISEVTDKENRIYYIEAGDTELSEPFRLAIEKLPGRDFQIRKGKNMACLDFEKLEFPLLIRKWQPGDYFQPLGMSGFKKVSDFLIDEKIPLHEKENTWLLCSGNKIVWIMGHRIDNRFKIKPETPVVFKIKIHG